MRIRGAFLGAVVLAAGIVFACSSGGTGGATGSSPCTAGAATACTGAGGCAGSQTCSPDGLSYGPCACVSTVPDATPGSDGSTPESGTDASSDADADADVDAGPWTPKQLGGLALWLDGNVGVVTDPVVSGKVNSWQDQSGNGNDAVSTNTPFPTTEPALLNGHTVINCGGNDSSLNIADSPSMLWGTGDFMIALVAKVRNSGGSVSLWQKTGDLVFAFDLTATNDFKLTLGLQSVSLAAPAFANFESIVARGAATELRVGGSVSTGPVSVQNISNAGYPTMLCFVGGSATEEIAEVIAVKGKVSDGDLGKTQAYLETKFGL